MESGHGAENPAVVQILAPGSSLHRRVAYSPLVVRLILVPVIFLAVYYLFRMGWIADRIVNLDAPATTLSEQVSVEMLEARRAERNYLLLRNPACVEANRASIAKTRETLVEIHNLAPSEQPDAQRFSNRADRFQIPHIRNEEVAGSIPVSSTKLLKVLCESRMLCPVFGVMSQVVSSLLKLRESDLPPLPLSIPVRRIIGDWCGVR